MGETMPFRIRLSERWRRVGAGFGRALRRLGTRVGSVLGWIVRHGKALGLGLLLLALATVLVRELRRPTLELRLLSVPERLTASGYSAESLVDEFRGELDAIVATASAVVGGIPQSQEPLSVELEVGAASFSLDRLLRYLREWAGSEQHDVMLDVRVAQGGLELRVRVGGHASHRAMLVPGREADAYRRLAERVVATVRPVVYLSYVSKAYPDDDERFLEAAIQVLSAEEGRRPARFYNVVANVRKRQGDAVGAEAAYREAIAEEPSDGAPRIGLGALYLGQDRLDEAIEVLEPVLKLDPERAPGAHGLLALIHHTKQEYAQALPHFDAAAKSEPADGELHAIWGNALRELGRYDEASLHYLIANTVDPDDQGVLVFWALNHLAAGEPARAAELLKSLTARDPENCAYWSSYADVLEDLGRGEEAAEAWMRASTLGCVEGDDAERRCTEPESCEPQHPG